MVPETIRPEDGLIFLETAAFEGLADKYLGTEGRDKMQADLLEDPEAGDVIAGTDGARKLRVSLDGRGKSGGARVIYYFRHTRGAIFFLALYPKNQKANVTDADKKALKAQIRIIKEEAYP